MELPEDLKIRAVLTQGGVFKAQLSEGRDSYPRYYFVLNISPDTDELLILSTSTTRFEQHQSCRGGDDVHIPLSPDDYEGLTRNCLICCDRPKKVKKESLITQLKSQRYEILPPLPSTVLCKILVGIEKSPVIEAKIKKLIIKDSAK